MKRVNVAVIMAVLAAAPLARAQQLERDDWQSLPEQQSVPVPYKAGHAGEPSRIDVPEHYRRMWPQDFDNFRRGYTLSNGQTLTIAPRGQHMYARIDGEPWHKIVAAAPNTFVALDRQLKMEINLQDDDRVKGWVLMVVPPRTLAGGEFVPQRVLRVAMR